MKKFRNRCVSSKCEYALVVFIVIMLFTSQAVFACSCFMSDDPLGIESFKAVDAIFIGKVIHVETIEYRYAVRLQVVEAFKGVEPGEITVYTNLGSNACGYNFIEEETYLIFAEKDSPITDMKGGRLSVSKCGRTKPLAEGVEDIKIIKRYLGE